MKGGANQWNLLQMDSNWRKKTKKYSKIPSNSTKFACSKECNFSKGKTLWNTKKFERGENSWRGNLKKDKGSQMENEYGLLGLFSRLGCLQVTSSFSNFSWIIKKILLNIAKHFQLDSLRTIFLKVVDAKSNPC